MAGTRDADACPGALRPHQAADGALARIRLPGGMITAAQLATLASVASDFGSATLELTARGNVQLRGIRDVAAVADAVAKAGLLPSATHERVRNIVASPLSGRAGGLADVRAWVGELDAAIRAEPRLAELGGRFWFGLDDGRADVSGLGADVGVQVFPDGPRLLLTGRDTGVRVADVAETLIEVALRFVKIRETAWRVTELADIGELQSGVELGPSVRPVTKTPVGWIPQDDSRVTLGAAVPLGVLPARVAECLAAIEAPLVITPWRSVLICDLDDATADAALRVLAPAGPGVRRELPLAEHQRLHRQPRLRALGRRRTGRRRAVTERGVSRASAFRRLRAGLRQPTGRRGAGRHRRWIPAIAAVG